MFKQASSCDARQKAAREFMLRIHMKPKVFLYLYCLLNLLFLETNGQIFGKQQKCSDENRPVEIPGITGDPCLSCYCKGGFVKCDKESCPPLTCHVRMKSRGRCCPVCQGCEVNNTIYEPSIHWRRSGGPVCADTNCNNGILTLSKIQCHSTCSRPLAPTSDECCPSCSGCVVGGVLYSEDEYFTLPGDICTTCLCKNGRTTCSKKSCPVIACGARRTRFSKDGCCLECVGHRNVFDLDEGDCWFQREILRHQQMINVDQCTTCVCQGGTIVCDRQSCPAVRSCHENDLLHKPDQCCPMCPEDFVVDCVRINEETRKHGETWTLPHDPCRKCLCANGSVTCTEVTCLADPPKCDTGKVLERIPGKCCKACVPRPGICTVFGDPHYRTFDGRPFNFQGDCKYVLTQDCFESYFSVIVQNDGRRSRSFSWTKTVVLQLFESDEMPDTTISLHQRLVVRINGKKVYLPHETSFYDIRNVKGYVEVKTLRGVSLRWDGDSFLEVGASPVHRGSLCGLCGNFNGFARDDFIGGDGSFIWDKIAFAESWKATNNIFDCTRPNYDAQIKRPCGNNLSALLKAREKCSIFKTVPFRFCYDAINPVDYYDSCVMDTCECPHNRKCSCESIRAYTQACSREGINIQWNEKQYCKRTCKHGRFYSSCGPPCKLTCRNYKSNIHTDRCLRRPCVAGCHCPAGQVLYRRKCIKTTSCPLRRLKSKQNKSAETRLKKTCTKRTADKT